MSTETPNTTTDEDVKDGIYYGVDDEGNPFFTAEGSESHRAAQRKKEATDASQAETVSEENKNADTAAKPGRKKTDSVENSSRSQE